MSETTPENTKPAKAAKAEAPATQRVILQRPYGVTDSHTWIGFNDYGAQVQYDVPVTLPTAVVEHLRTCERVEYRADEKGNPVAAYSRTYSIVDAPAEA